MIVQKYHSISEIDPEFLPGIESLMNDSIPKFDWMMEAEKKEDEKNFFHYYLFFSGNSNSPTGFARFKFIPKEEKSSSFSKIQHWLKKSETSKKMEGDIYIDPKHSREIREKFDEMLSELSDKINVREVELKSPFEVKTFNSPRISEVPWAMIKQAKSYQEEVLGLSLENQAKVKRLWKEYHLKNLTIGLYENFRAIFRNKPDGLLLYKGLKEEEKLLRYHDLNPEFIVLENETRPILVVFFIKGSGGNYFYDYMNLDDTLITSEHIVHELIKMKFYDSPEAHYLHPLFIPLIKDEFKGVYKKFFHYDWVKTLS